MLMKILLGLVLAAVLGTVALVVYARLRPLDPAALMADATAPGFVPPGRDGAAFCAPAGAPVSLAPGELAALDAVAVGWPRTTRLAGSVAEGRIAWVTRSRLIGYPDVTTAQIVGTGEAARLCLVARQVIGQADMGVNGARLRAWIRAVAGLDTAPDLVWQPPAQ